MIECNESCSNYWSGCDMQCMDDELEEAMEIWENEFAEADFAEWVAHMEETF